MWNSAPNFKNGIEMLPNSNTPRAWLRVVLFLAFILINESFSFLRNFIKKVLHYCKYNHPAGYDLDPAF